MIDYSKFVLKPKKEIIAQLKDADEIFLIGCNKCFKEYKRDEITSRGMNQNGSYREENERVELVKILEEDGKKVLGSLGIDFLCNRTITEEVITSKILKDQLLFQEAECFLVHSCGFGVQTVAELTNRPVYTAADSVYQGGQHGMALTGEGGNHLCAGCAQCFLGMTAGICPITNCAKGLLNGPCGGAKNGKCEVATTLGKDKDCAWEKIYQRLNLLSSEQRVASNEIVVRDYTKPSLKTKNVLTGLVRERRLQSFYGGVYPLEKKEFTSDKPIKIAPEPKEVVIPLLQHTGCPAEPLVKPGDKVLVGQKIGQSVAGRLSANIHSSISGKVKAIELRKHPVCPEEVLSVIIENDGKNQLSPEIKSKPALENLSPEEIREIIFEAGIVGMGGAMFPTAVKLCPPKDKKVDTFILNGAECEPYLTADERVMIEHTEEVIFGMKALMKAIGVNKGYIAIEENKPEAIAKLRAKSEELGKNIEIVELKTKYPQGAERMLIKRILGREVPPGCLPFDVGVIVNNVSTAVAVAQAIKTGLPLIKRTVTVTGEKIENPQNLEVKIGTSFRELIEFCGGIINGEEVITSMGGPMMGIVQKSLDLPVIKGTTGILVTLPSEIEFTLERACIKCGRCLDICPVELNPSTLSIYAENQDWETMKKHNVLNCIECGSCNYICPSKRSLVQAFKLAKSK